MARIAPKSLNSGTDHVTNIIASVNMTITPLNAKKTKSVAKNHTLNHFKKLLTILNLVYYTTLHAFLNIPCVRFAKVAREKEERMHSGNRKLLIAKQLQRQHFFDRPHRQLAMRNKPRPGRCHNVSRSKCVIFVFGCPESFYINIYF